MHRSLSETHEHGEGEWIAALASRHVTMILYLEYSIKKSTSVRCGALASRFVGYRCWLEAGEST
jgi:hypothetical protein